MRTNLICLFLVLLLHSESTHNFFNGTLPEEDPSTTSFSTEMTEGQMIAGLTISALCALGGCVILYKNWKKPTRAELLQRKNALEHQKEQETQAHQRSQERLEEEILSISKRLEERAEQSLLEQSRSDIELDAQSSFRESSDLPPSPDPATDYEQLTE